MEDILDVEDSRASNRLEERGGITYGSPHLLRLAENLYSSLINHYGVEDLMKTVAEHRDKEVFVMADKNTRETHIIIDSEGKYSYSTSETLCVPVPKKFAILEPDKNYFEMTLKANIILSLMEVKESELHR